MVKFLSSSSSSQLLHLFNQLKTEILQSHIMETTFVLVQELLTAAEKSFNLKKYFWKVFIDFCCERKYFCVLDSCVKSPDLFLCLVTSSLSVINCQTSFSSLRSLIVFSHQISLSSWWVNLRNICPVLQTVLHLKKEATEKMSWSKYLLGH